MSLTWSSCPPKPENLTTSFRETEIVLAPFTGGPDAKILFLSTQRPPTAQKISSPWDLPFYRYGVKSSTFSLFPQNWVCRFPPYFARGILGMTPKNPKNFVKLSPPFSEIFGIFHFPKVSYT